MACTLTLSLISESQEGDVGDDWKYELETKVFSGALAGQGTISVPKHQLASGETQEPHGNPAAIAIPAGEPGAEIKINLKLTATEVDLFRDDSGTQNTSIVMVAPHSGGEKVVKEADLSVGVVEMPGQMSSAVFTLRIGLALASD